MAVIWIAFANGKNVLPDIFTNLPHHRRVSQPAAPTTAGAAQIAEEEIQPSSSSPELMENQCVDEAGKAQNLNLNDLAVNKGDSDRAPYVGMKFESEEAAKVFYDAYATHMGFIVRVDASGRSMCGGDMVCRRLVCDKEGFHKCRLKRSENGKGRAITQEGCKAMIVVKKENTGKWVVTEFFKEHDHPLVNSRRNAHPAGWVWKRELLQGVKATINLYYRDSILVHIESVLQCVGGEETVQQFRSGCFGHFLQYTGGTSCNKALHALLAQEIITPGSRDDEVWFRINDRHIRFSFAEYALVTGLNFGSSTFDPHEAHEIPNGIYRRLFDAAPISISELWKKFISRHIGGSADDYLKVANVLLLYLMLIGYDTFRLIDEWIWVLIEDAAQWNNFPWGAYTFQVLMHYIRILPVHPPNSSAKISYHFYGPVFALQIWAYEAIPEFGSTCAHMDGLVSIPRCLKWSFPRRSIDFTTFFTRELECMESLLPTGDELVQPYWRSLQHGDPLGVRFVTKGNPIKLGLPVIRRMTSVASRVIQAPQTISADVAVQQLGRSRRRRLNDVETNIEPAERPTTKVSTHDSEPFECPSIPIKSNACLPRETSCVRTSRRCICGDTTAFEERLAVKISNEIVKEVLPQIKDCMEDCLRHAKNDKDEKTRELRAELQRERRKSAALQEQLNSVVKELEEHSKHLSNA